jgi:hypothetical protein
MVRHLILLIKKMFINTHQIRTKNGIRVSERNFHGKKLSKMNFFFLGIPELKETSNIFCATLWYNCTSTIE